jgi:hypothetical protein
MRPRLVIACLLAVAAAAAQADCRRGGVEWIVGGPAPFDCETLARKPAAGPVMTPAAHKIDPARQRLLDDERRGILARELAEEESRLPRAADADSALRIRDNIAALKREMARLAPPAR